MPSRLLNSIYIIGGNAMFFALLVLLPILGALAAVVSLLVLVIAVIRKKSKKGALIALGISVAITVLSYMLYGSVLGQ